MTVERDKVLINTSQALSLYGISGGVTICFSQAAPVVVAATALAFVPASVPAPAHHIT